MQSREAKNAPFCTPKNKKRPHHTGARASSTQFRGSTQIERTKGRSSFGLVTGPTVSLSEALKKVAPFPVQALRWFSQAIAKGNFQSSIASPWWLKACYSSWSTQNLYGFKIIPTLFAVGNKQIARFPGRRFGSVRAAQAFWGLPAWHEGFLRAEAGRVVFLSTKSQSFAMAIQVE
ncbi:MAG: hypothetical protein ACOYYS_04405 [Chloroflexota bacterium]